MHKTLFILFLIFSTSVFPCGMFVSGEFEDSFISAEKVLLVWNQATKTQHFIRKIDLDSKAKSLGFIVPVPSLPEVSDFDEDVFVKLNEKKEELRPKHYRLTGLHDFIFGRGEGSGGILNSAGPGMDFEGSTQEHSRFTLKNYDVKVISATGIEPMTSWLNQNQFEINPEGLEWINGYIQKKWYFVAFKFSGMKSKEFSTDVIRLSYKTEMPFYPYSEPTSTKHGDSRRLDLHFLSASAHLPDFLPDSWDGRPVFSHKISLPKELENLAGQSDVVFTQWQDYTLQRPQRDIFFNPGALDDVLPHPIETDLASIVWPIVLLGLIFLVCSIIYRGLKKLIVKPKKRTPKPIIRKKPED